MSFQDSFWGPRGFEELRKVVKDGQDFTKEIVSVLHERAELEATYAKALSKFSTRIAKATKLALGTTQKAWLDVADEMEKEAELHRLLSTGLEEDVSRPLKILINGHHKQSKLLENTVDKAAKTLNDHRNEESKCKKYSYKCARENEGMQEQVLDSKSNRGKMLTEKDIRKLESKRKKSGENVIKAEVVYYTSALTAERARQDWESSVYRVSAALQQLEEDRLNSMGDFIQKYANHLNATGPSFEEGIKRLNDSISSIDIPLDLQDMVRVKGTGPNIPEQILPDFYAENLSNEMKKERRKESLERFSKLLKHDLESERKGKQGVENLARVFHDTPKFADTNSQRDVFDELQRMRCMLAYYEAARFKIQCSLVEMEGQERPSHPLSAYMEIRNKQEMCQTVLKVPRWVQLKRRNSGSSGSCTSDISDLYPELPCEQQQQLQCNNSENQNTLADTRRRLSRNQSSPAGSISVPRGNQSPQTRVINRVETEYTEYQLYPTISEAPVGIQCQALYGFEGRQNDELSFNPGDVITMVEKGRDGWWHGYLNGRIGVFPSTYVKEISAH